VPWTVDDVLADEAIDRFERHETHYSFWLKGIPTEITVSLTANPARGGFNFRLSHHIHTPCQGGPYQPGRPWGDDEGYTLRRAVTAITEYYSEASRAGWQPSPTWLVPS
jgi:hypothetical protein